MSSPVLANHTPSRHNSADPSIGRLTHGRVTLIIIAAAVLFTAMFLASRIWPFSEQSVLQNLSEAGDSEVIARNFRRRYFPFPGCVLEGVVFRHGPEKRTFITIEKLSIRGSYFGLLRRHLPNITADGGHVYIAPLGSHEAFHIQHSNIVVEELVSNGTVVDFLPDDPRSPPVTFVVHEFFVHNLRSGYPFEYRLKFHNPKPPGEIDATGRFGPYKIEDPRETPMSGYYTFDRADLGVYGGVAGTLSSTGKFSGLLRHIDIEGTTDMPDFEVTSGGRKVQLKTTFNAYVDATNGDTFLHQVDSHWGRTLVRARGSVAGDDSHKVARFDLSARDSRIEDVLGLFVKARRSPMSGAVTLKARAEIYPGHERFLEKVRLQGTFGIEDGSFSKSETQKNVNELSAGARGENKDDPETVLTNLKGQVTLEGGTARFSNLSFEIPGASATMHGTYNILSHKIDLHGTMQVDTKISKTTSGVKALLLKVMDPLFKKKKKGEIVPVHIGGTYEKPQFGLEVTKSPDAEQGKK